jgi:hypothetical protein
VAELLVQDGEELIVGKRLRAVLDGARKREL